MVVTRVFRDRNSVFKDSKFQVIKLARCSCNRVCNSVISDSRYRFYPCCILIVDFQPFEFGVLEIKTLNEGANNTNPLLFNAYEPTSVHRGSPIDRGSIIILLDIPLNRGLLRR